jgi:hypothetical protein
VVPGPAASCHCLCLENHPDAEDVCIGAQDTELAFVLLGLRVDIPLCSPCATASLAAMQNRENDPLRPL